MSRLNALALAASTVIVALGYGDRPWVAAALVFAVITVILVIAVPRRPRSTPVTITRLPTEYERRQGGSKWLYGLFIRVPIIPFLSIGLFRWRGRK